MTSTAPARQDELVAVANPFDKTWSLKVPGRQWLQAPVEQGHEVLAACVSCPQNATTYAIWRVVQSGEGVGVTKCAIGRRGQPISSRMAAALKRMGMIPGAAPGTVGSPAGAEAPVQTQLTAAEVSEFGNTVPSAVLSDAEPITAEDMGGTSTAMVVAGPGVAGADQGVAVQPPVDTPPSVFGIPLPKLLLLGGLAWGGYKLYRNIQNESGGGTRRPRSNPRHRPVRRKPVPIEPEPEDDDGDDGDDDEDDEDGEE